MKISIKNHNFNVRVMVTPKDIQTGMMDKRFTPEFNGMLFVMDESEHCFWMKNCIIPLDIVFIKNNVIQKIHHNCHPCIEKDCNNYCGYGNLVLELPGNDCKIKNIKESDKINFIT